MGDQRADTGKWQVREIVPTLHAVEECLLYEAAMDGRRELGSPLCHGVCQQLPLPTGHPPNVTDNMYGMCALSNSCTCI